jgi:hypothetical protein
MEHTMEKQSILTDKNVAHYLHEEEFEDTTGVI